MFLRRAYFRRYPTGAFRKILGTGRSPEEALLKALQKATDTGLLSRGYRCVGGEDVKVF